MACFFIHRNYPQTVIDRALRRVNNITRETAMRPSDDADSNKKVIPLILTFGPQQSPNLTGTFPCNRPRCKTCAHTNASPQINTPGGPLTIRQRFSCTTSNLVYLITCRACTLVYIGETGRRLGDRFCEHLRSVKKKTDLPVAKHFCSPGHTTEDMVSVVRAGFRNVHHGKAPRGGSSNIYVPNSTTQRREH